MPVAYPESLSTSGNVRASFGNPVLWEGRNTGKLPKIPLLIGNRPATLGRYILLHVFGLLIEPNNFNKYTKLCNWTYFKWYGF